MTVVGDPTVWLPIAFAALMGLSILLYVILDGFDLGVGILLPFAESATQSGDVRDDALGEKDRKIASIGPF